MEFGGTTSFSKLPFPNKLGWSGFPLTAQRYEEQIFSISVASTKCQYGLNNAQMHISSILSKRVTSEKCLSCFLFIMYSYLKSEEVCGRKVNHWYDHPEKHKHPLIYVIPHSFKNIFWNPIHPFNIISPQIFKTLSVWKISNPLTSFNQFLIGDIF